jgi:8-oxo-dGTP pyrophosphatase MutT (NUDIX family)
VVRALAERGIVEGWRNEAFAVAAHYGEPPLLRLERAAVPVFGVKAYGVHMNGFVRDGERIRLWVGRRADNRQIEPGKLDNIVAGGLPIGLDPLANLIKECAEEAGIDEALARQAKPVGAMSYRMLHQDFLRRDTLFLYDLELPADFVPANADGEIAEFRLMELDEVTAILAETEAFKFNVAPVVIDFLIRHGHLAPDQSGYADLALGLTGLQPFEN